MAPDVFDRETMLDLSVNVIPLFIILFFVVVFAVIAPFGYDFVPTAIQMALLIVHFVGLAVLTYYAGKAIAESEAELEAREREVAGASSVESTPESNELPHDDADAEDGEPTPAITEAETDGDATEGADDETDDEE